MPFHLGTILKALWQRRRLVLVALGFAVVLGVVAGLFLGKQKWQAETVLLYKPPPPPEDMPNEAVPLSTQMHMVKINANLDLLRERLQVAGSLEAIGAACQITVEKNADLLYITTSWDTATGAADLANGLREVFLENQRRRYREEYKSRVEESRARLRQVQRDLEAADNSLSNFTIKYGIVDLDKQAQWDLEQSISLEALYVQAQVDSRRVELQRANFDKILKRLTDQMNREEQDRKGASETLGDINLRFRRLRDAISDDRGQRSAVALLTEKKLKYENAVRAKENGVASAQEVREAEAAYLSQKALTEDTEQIKAWKAEIAELDKMLAPKSNDMVPSGRLLQEMMLRGFDIELEQAAVGERVESYRKALEDVKTRLGKLPELQRRYSELARDVTAKETERKVIEKSLAGEEKALASGGVDFSVVSEAKPPIYPTKSTRKSMALIAFGGTMLLCIASLLLLEVFTPVMRSGPEAAQKLGLPALAVFPDLRSSEVDRRPDQGPPELWEAFRIFSHRLRVMVPSRGVRILVTSAVPGEGRTTLALGLAAALGRQDERILLMEGDARARASSRSVLGVLAEPGKSRHGLSDYLAFAVDSVDQAVSPSVLAGVEVLPAGSEAALPDLIGSKRMEEAMRDLAKVYSAVIIDGPAVLPYVDVDLLAKSADAVIMVVRAGTTPVAKVEQAIQRFKTLNKPILGLAVNRVDRVFM